MSKTYTIHVTQADIDEGCQSSADNCPIAKAITREYGYLAKVGALLITLHTDAKAPHFGSVKTPAIAAVFIGTYDDNGPSAVSPFSFELELPDKPVELTLTQPEARTLAVLLATIGGSPGRSPRGHTENVARKLSAAGVASYSQHKEWKLKGNGGLFFNNYADRADMLNPDSYA